MGFSSVAQAAIVLSLPAACFAQEASRNRITDRTYRTNYRVDSWDDARDEPYRVTFWKFGLKSVYLFDVAGHVRSLTARDTLYTFDVDVGSRMLRSPNDEVLEDAYFDLGSLRIDCSTCAVTWNTLCDVGLPEVCFLHDNPPVDFDDDAIDSVRRMCSSFGEACRTSAFETCDGQCVVSGLDPTPAPATEATLAPVTEATPAPVTIATPTPVTQATPAPVTIATPTPVTQATPAPVTMATPTPVTQATPAPVTMATPTPVTQATPAPVTMATPTPVTQATPAPVTVTTLTPSTQATPAPVTGPTPAPMTDMTTAPETVSTPAPVTGMTPAPVTEATQTPIAEATAAPSVEATPAPVIEPTGTPIAEPTPAPIEPVDDECNPNPCENEGTCSIDPAGGHMCSCASDFGGMACQTDISSLDTFFIEIEFIGVWTAARMAVFESAADRWAEVITHVPCGGTTGFPAGRLLIGATLEEIDGVGGVLGSAGPESVWNACNTISAEGNMRFDIDDILNLEANGSFEGVILHEMGHVIGVGTLWGDTFGECTTCRRTGNPAWTCPAALSTYADIGGSGADIVELDGEAGTSCSHLDEIIFTDELMTGFVDNPMFLSKMTAAVLDDLKYIVDASAVDAYTLPSERDAGIKTSTVASVVTDIAADALIKLLDTDGDVIREVLGVVVKF